MVVGVTLFIIAALIISIWIIVEFKRVRHKVFALFLIGLVLFLYFTSSFVFRGHDLDFKTVSGITTGAKLYFSWLGSVFSNVKSITSNAIKMNWKTNSSVG